MKGITKALALFLCGVLLCSCCAAAQREPSGFYRVSGQDILGPTGEPVLLRGMHFNNGVYQKPQSEDDPAIALAHTAESYREVAEMGLDHVRLALNYHLFEDDSAPYTYKEDGFAVIDRNLEWAKAAGVTLILQMKWPQGGYQMETEQMAPADWFPGNGGKSLWMDIDENGTPLDTENYKENQKRLVALWTEIARRYADEPAIIGYNLFNEPVIPQKGTAEETIGQLQSLMQRIADSIRTEDTNHILFVERAVGWFDPEDPAQSDWELFSVSDTQYLIDDDNTVYEFHFYEPFSFTHQGADWLPQFPVGEAYPSTRLMDCSVEDWSPRYSLAALGGQTEGDWQYFESEPFSAGVNSDGAPYNFARVQVAAAGLAAGESVWFDDLTVTCTDSEGKPSVLYTDGFEDGLGAFEWGGVYDMNGTAAFAYDPVEGHTDAGALCISERTGGNYADVGSEDWFFLREGCTYQISGWVKGSGGYPQVSAVFAEEVLMADRDYVERMLDTFLAFGEENGVPVYAGEWGVHCAACDYGYEAYIEDLCALMAERNLSSTYYSYRDGAFGLYICEDNEPLGGKNGKLYELLKSCYGSTRPAIVSGQVDGKTVTACFSGTPSGKLVAAVYDQEGRFLDMESQDLTGEASSAVLSLPREVPAGGAVTLFLLRSDTWQPLCPAVTKKP